jgi:hypothetical protein
MNKLTMIKYSNVIKISIFVIIFQVYCSCKDNPTPFRGEVYKLAENKYAYKIYFKQKLFIKQETIPAVEGINYFTDSIFALKTMDLVLSKLNHKKNPILTEIEIEKLKTIP